MNWLRQIFSVTLFNLKTIPQRRRSAAAAAVGIAGVAAASAIVLRQSADNEMTSGLSRDEVRLIHDAPGIARSADGPLASAELFVMINLPKRSTGTDANVPMRGVEK